MPLIPSKNWGKILNALDGIRIPPRVFNIFHQKNRACVHPRRSRSTHTSPAPEPARPRPCARARILICMEIIVSNWFWFCARARAKYGLVFNRYTKRANVRFKLRRVSTIHTPRINPPDTIWHYKEPLIFLFTYSYISRIQNTFNIK